MIGQRLRWQAEPRPQRARIEAVTLQRRISDAHFSADMPKAQRAGRHHGRDVIAVDDAMHIASPQQLHQPVIPDPRRAKCVYRVGRVSRRSQNRQRTSQAVSRQEQRTIARQRCDE
jgi:hypothetical protein